MIETIKITVITPTLTPSIVNAERSLFARRVSKAIRADSLMSSRRIGKLSGLRTQESEVAYYSICISCQQATDLLKLIVQFTRVTIIKICDQDKVVTTLFKRPLRDIQESRLIVLTFLLEALYYICGYRNCSATELRCQTIHFITRKLLAKSVRC